MSRDCGELVTCQLTIDNSLDAVYFNNEDITSTITSASGDAASVRVALTPSRAVLVECMFGQQCSSALVHL